MTQPSLSRHRARLAERGLRRVEVSVPIADAEVIRAAARELAAGSKAGETIRLLVTTKPRPRFADWVRS